MFDIEELHSLFREHGRDAVVEKLCSYGELTAQLTKTFLALSSPLRDHPEQFLTQLVSAILSADTVVLSPMADCAGELRETTWLRPLLPSLTCTDPCWSYSLCRAPEQPVEGMLLLPDNRTLIAGDNAGYITVWDFRTGERRHTFQAHEGSIQSLLLTSDPGRVISAADESPIKIWNRETWELERTLDGHQDIIISITADESGHLLSSSDDCTIRRWRIDTGECLAVWKADGSPVVMSPDGRWALGLDYDKLEVWDVETGRVLHTFDREDEEALGHREGPCTAAWLDEQRWVTLNTELVVWHLDGPRHLHRFGDPGGRMDWAALHPDRHRMATATDGGIQVWDLENGECLAAMVPLGSANSVALTADPEVLLTANHRGVIDVWDVPTLLDPPKPAGHPGKVQSLAITSDGEHVVSAGRDGEVIVWNRAGEPLRTLQAEGLRPREARLLPDERTALTYTDHAVQLWNIEDGELLHTIDYPNGEAIIEYLATDDSGRFAASCDDEGKLTLWDLQAGEAHIWDSEANCRPSTLR